MSQLRLFLFLLAGAGLISVAAVFAGRPAGSTVIHVLDPSGAPYADAVVLINPGHVAYSIALVTDRSGTATVPRLKCKMCMVTAIDPRRLFYDKTTQFEGGTPSVTVTLAGVRGTNCVVWDPEALKVTVQVKGLDGEALAGKDVVIRNKVGTIEENTFIVVRTDRQGRISLKSHVGQYVLASLANGRFLEALLNLAPAVRRRCSQAESDCYIANAVRSKLQPPPHFTVKLAPPGNSH